ncbi:hypothetical protein MTO96_014585 [Rhipicephalus appendiculatus]
MCRTFGVPASPGQPTLAVSRKLAEAAGRCHAPPFVPPGMRALAHSLVTPSLECTVDLSPYTTRRTLGIEITVLSRRV